MRITLYTNPFMHDGIRHVGVMVMVWRGQIEIIGSYSMQSYASTKDTYMAAMEAYRTADATKRMLEELGHTVEIEDELKTGSATISALEEALKQ